MDEHGRVWTTRKRGRCEIHGPRRQADTALIRGYRIVTINKRIYRAHRLIYALTYGECPADLMVLHQNGNPLDNRPENLAVGTAWDNAQDLKRHGNRPDRRGANHPLAKLDEDIVREMRRLYAEGHSRRSIAERFGHSYSHTGEIIARRAWANVA